MACEFQFGLGSDCGCAAPRPPDCNDLTGDVLYIWFDPGADGTYELGPYPMTYHANGGNWYHTYLFARTITAVNHMADGAYAGCTTVGTGDVYFSLLYWKYTSGASSGQHGVQAGYKICSPGVGTRILTGDQGVAWTRTGTAFGPQIVGGCDAFSPVYPCFQAAGIGVGVDSCAFVVAVGSPSGGFTADIYPFRITYGPTPF